MSEKAKKTPKNIQKSRTKKFIDEWVIPLGIAFLVAFFFRTTIASPRHIPTGSMIPTIKIGEFIFVNMLAYDIHIPFTRSSLKERSHPSRGEIVVFEYPSDPDKDYIKRVIGIPGDVIEVQDKRVILNGTPLSLEPITDRAVLEDLTPKYDPEQMSLFTETNGEHKYTVVHMNERPGFDLPPTTVPADSYFVMGDNRDDSQDSRYWGFVKREKFLGRAGFIWLSFNKDHFPFFRFNRFFTDLI